MAKKRVNACEFSQAARNIIKERDRGCIFCKMGYTTEGALPMDLATFGGIMHFIPRSKGGLGIPENGAIGCYFHHNMLDNGNQGNRSEMLELFEKYLRSQYPDWDVKKLVFMKWHF